MSSIQPTKPHSKRLWVKRIAAALVLAVAVLAADFFMGRYLSALTNPMIAKIKWNGGWDDLTDVTSGFDPQSSLSDVDLRMRALGFKQEEHGYFTANLCQNTDALPASLAEVADGIAQRCKKARLDRPRTYKNRDYWVEAEKAGLGDLVYTTAYQRARTEFPCGATYHVHIFADDSDRLEAAIGSYSETGCL